MNVNYQERYEAASLVNHPKGLKSSYKPAAQSLKKSEAFAKRRHLKVGLGQIGDL